MVGFCIVKTISRMKSKITFWSIFLLIIAISWFDFQYFNEGYYSRFVPASSRQTAHFIVLILVAVIGYFAWINFPLKWMKKIWATSYGAFFLIQFLVGILQKTLLPFSKDFLDQIHSIRLIFVSPFPFLTLYFVYLLIKNGRLKT